MSIPLTDVHIAEVVTRGLLAAGGSDSQNCLNVYHWIRGTTTVNPDKSNIKAAFVTNILAALYPLVSSDFTSPLVSVRYPEDADDQYTDYSNATAGSIATDRLPDHSCVTMVLRTNKRGRRYQGQKHFGGVPEASTTKDLLTAGASPLLTGWLALATAIQAGFTDSDGNVWTPIVLSRKFSQLKENPTVVIYADVKQVLVNKNLGTMRSRRVATVR